MSNDRECHPCASGTPRQGDEQDQPQGDIALYDELAAINNELINAQRQLVQKNVELEKLAAENARLYAEAQDLLRMHQVFVSILTHDLKTPVSSILGYTQLLARRISRDVGHDQARLLSGLRQIETAAEKMTKQINEVLEVERLQRGEMLPLNREQVDLVALVTRVSAELQPKSMQPQITVEAALPSIVGQWDGRRLERVLNNLLTNAIKYSPEGGKVLVEIERGAATTTQPIQAVIRVRDQGLGIPAEDLPHIFEPFHRANNTIDRIDGTGIGLFSVLQIVEQHAGTITVESEEGIGTTFTVHLPLAFDVSDDGGNHEARIHR